MDAGNGKLGREPARAAVRPRLLGVTGGREPGRPGQGRSPFEREGRLARLLPFAVVAAVAEASLALPPGPQSVPGLTISLVLLAVVAGAVFLPWGWLPRWLALGVPLAYLGSAGGLTVASGGFNSGVDLVLLVPVVWTALFHRPWESAAVVSALAGAGFVASLFPGEAPPAIIFRRVLFLTAVAVMISVAAHILRAQVRRSEAATARLQGRLRELSITADRDRIASSLHDTVVQRLFTAGLSLQGTGQLAGDPELRRRIDAVVHSLDDAIKLLRQSIFGLGHGLPAQGLRRSILDVSHELTPALGMVPEIALDGPIDTAVPAAAGAELLTALREALACSGSTAQATRVAVTVAADGGEVRLSVTDDGIRWAARAVAEGPRLDTLRDLAERLGGTMQAGPADGGDSRLVWRVPLPPAEPGTAAAGEPEAGAEPSAEPGATGQGQPGQGQPGQGQPGQGQPGQGIPS